MARLVVAVDRRSAMQEKKNGAMSGAYFQLGVKGFWSPCLMAGGRAQ